MGNSCSTSKYVWATRDGQGDAFTKKFLSAEGVFVTTYFLWIWAHKGDERKKELKQLIENIGERAKQCDFSCITL